MLVMPIINRGRALNVEFKLAQLQSKNEVDVFSELKESEIYANGHKFSESVYNTKVYTPSNITRFIRNHSINSRVNFYTVTSKSAADNNNFETYDIVTPPSFITNGFDNLYGEVVNDIRKQNNTAKRGRLLSLEKIGLTETFTEERIKRLNDVSNSNVNVCEQREFSDIVETLDNLKLFDCTIIEHSAINLESLEHDIEALKRTNTKCYKELENYLETAKKNAEVYSMLSYLSRIVYDKPLNLVSSPRIKKRVKTNAA